MRGVETNKWNQKTLIMVCETEKQFKYISSVLEEYNMYEYLPYSRTPCYPKYITFKLDQNLIVPKFDSPCELKVWFRIKEWNVNYMDGVSLYIEHVDILKTEQVTIKVVHHRCLL